MFGGFSPRTKIRYHIKSISLETLNCPNNWEQFPQSERGLYGFLHGDLISNKNVDPDMFNPLHDWIRANKHRATIFNLGNKNANVIQNKPASLLKCHLIRLFRYTKRGNLFCIWLMWTKFGLLLYFSDRLSTKRNSSWCQIIRKSVIIQFKLAID